MQTVSNVLLSIASITVFLQCTSTVDANPVLKRRHNINPHTGQPVHFNPQQFEYNSRTEQPDFLVHNQDPGTLSFNSSENLAGPDARLELRCNACLVVVAEVAQSLRDFSAGLRNKGQSGTMKRQEAATALRSACLPGGRLDSFGLMMEAGRNKKVFAHFGAEEMLASHGYKMNKDPAVTEILQSVCNLILDEYEGDFMHIMSRPTQALEIQRRLCGPEPGIAYCANPKQDVYQRREEYQRKKARDRQAAAERAAAWEKELQESDDPLKYLYEKEEL